MADESAVLGKRPVSLDDLMALNDEIVSLTRSGMPLERGLLEVGGDLPGRLAGLTAGIGERMSQGAGLAEAIDWLGPSVPPVYRAVVVAGLRSGDLPRALEGTTEVARGVSEARRAIGLALWYPITVMLLAYVLFLFILTLVMPKFEAVFADMRLPVHGSIAFLARAGHWAWYWGPVLPVLMLVFVVGWFSTRGALNLHGGGRFGLLRWFPWMGRMIRDFEAATFAELLALLVEHGVPYPEALSLAGEASGDRRLGAACREMSARVEKGLAPADESVGPKAFPPLLGWLLVSGPGRDYFVPTLRQMAQRYRGDAMLRSEKIRVVLPTILLCGVGASATLLYAIAVFLPISTLWSGLSSPSR